MRRLLTALAVAVVLVGAQPATVAWAGPAPDLCIPDGTRGGVPADFLLDACVDATSMTVRNSLAVPVLVRRDGDLGAPVRVHERGSARATVQRLLSDPWELLMPGDVTRWPFGPGIAALTFFDPEPVTAAVAVTVTDHLPAIGGDEGLDVQAVAVVVRELAAAVLARASCAEGRNFLRVAACDVAGSSAISRAVMRQLPRATALELLPVVLDVAVWTRWTTPRATDLSRVGPPGRQLTLTPVPAPVVVPPEPEPQPAPAPASAPAPAPAPAAPAVPAAPVPAPSLPTAPTPQTSSSDWRAWWEATLARLAEEYANSTNGRGGSGRGHHD